MTDLAIQLCYLLDQYPLHHYVRTENGQKRLPILLLGTDETCETLLTQLLMAGQLLDTALELSVAGPCAAEQGKALLSQNPGLARFAAVTQNGTMVTDPKARYAVVCFTDASLTPDTVTQLLEKRQDWGYVLIAAGADGENAALAEACASFPCPHPTLVAYVQQEEPTQIPSGAEQVTVCPFGYQDEGLRFVGQLERIALNLHYSYAKFNNERESMAKLKEVYQTDHYTHLSNLQNAVHLRSKLAACGIELEDTFEAAQAFHAKLQEDDALVERLSALEHRRWIMEKVLDGYTPVPDIKLVFAKKGVTQRDKEARWHVCIVTSDETGGSRLRPSDWHWDRRPMRGGLDELDKMSLKVHDRCGVLAMERKARIYDLLEQLRAALSVRIGDHEVLHGVERLNRIITLLYQAKRRAMSLYQEVLEETLQLAKAAKISEDCSKLLEELMELVRPLVEFVRCQDYKELDRMLVRQIPFALTFCPEGSVVKLMSEQPLDNVLSAVYLEAGRLVLVSVAEDRAALEEQQSKLKPIRSYLAKRNLAAELEYHIIVPAELASAVEEAEGWCCTAHPTAPWNAPAVCEVLNGLLEEVRPNQIDVTGGAPELVVGAALWAKEHSGIGLFSRGGGLRELGSSCEVRYDTLHRSLSVEDMFLLHGARHDVQTGLETSEMTEKYQKLWEIVDRHVELWGGFCEDAKKERMAADKAAKEVDSVLLQLGRDPQWGIGYHISTTKANARVFLPVLGRLEEESFLRELKVETGAGETVEITFDAVYVSDGKELGRFLEDKARAYEEGVHWEFRQPYQEKPALWCRKWSCIVKNRGRAGLNRSFLMNELWQNDFISKAEPVNSYQSSFQILLPEMNQCIETSGSALEYYLYYTALLDCSFDDVEMGWGFHHSEEEGAASNEIDLICTKGISSLFVSAKLRREDAFTEGEKKSLKPLNYILYEILQMRSFGMNTKVALAAPLLPMFEENGAPSKYLKATQRRGVYLLGKECFTSGKLAQVLDAVAEGREDWSNLVRLG